MDQHNGAFSSSANLLMDGKGMHGTPAQGAQQGYPIRIENWKLAALAEDEPRDQCNRKTRVPRRPDSASFLVSV
ncbi:hypothetical protein IFR05_002475, partial [Cadophora sp. M221]